MRIGKFLSIGDSIFGCVIIVLDHRGYLGVRRLQAQVLKMDSAYDSYKTVFGKI